jgi:hypothetical protein
LREHEIIFRLLAFVNCINFASQILKIRLQPDKYCAHLLAARTSELIKPVSSLSSQNSIWGLAAVMVDNKWGFIDKTGSYVIVLQFKSVISFNEGHAVVWREVLQLSPR